MRTSGSLALVATAALALALTGCAGGPGAEKSEEESPLSKYLSAAWGGDLSPEEQQKKFEEQRREQEDLMAECMAKEGFEYKPNTDNGGGVVIGDDVKWEPDDKDWVKKYGYGMINSPYSEQMEEQPTEDIPEDPNQKYIESLSDSEEQAYYETLYGAGPDEEEMNEDGSYEYSWEDAGCQGWAQHEIEGENPWQSEKFTDLTDKMSELWTQTQESPEMKELNAEWASCMADAGEPGFLTTQEAQQSISDEQQKIFEAAYGDGTTPPEDPENVEDPSKSPEMKKLGEREIDLALKDLECREKTSYTKTARDIQFAAEEKFIAENKADLEAFKAAAEQSK